MKRGYLAVVVILVALLLAGLGLYFFEDRLFAGTSVPTVTVEVDEEAGKYVATFYNLSEADGGNTFFRFDPSDSACKDAGRVDEGKRYIYAGQIDEHYTAGGVGMERRERIGSDCPLHVEHTIAVRLWLPSGEDLASASAVFCLAGCVAVEPVAEVEVEAAVVDVPVVEPVVVEELVAEVDLEPVEDKGGLQAETSVLADAEVVKEEMPQPAAEVVEVVVVEPVAEVVKQEAPQSAAEAVVVEVVVVEEVVVEAVVVEEVVVEAVVVEEVVVEPVAEVVLEVSEQRETGGVASVADVEDVEVAETCVTTLCGLLRGYEDRVIVIILPAGEISSCLFAETE